METRLNKKVLLKTSLDDNEEDLYWQSKTPIERLKGLELNRSLVYGYGDNPPRLQRFLEVVEQERS